MVKFPWLQTAGRPKRDDRRTLLVFGRRHDLFPVQFEGDAVALVGHLPETHRVPVDHDFPAADAEETTEIDDRGTHRAFAIDDDIDDASHILVCGTANIAA